MQPISLPDSWHPFESGQDEALGHRQRVPPSKSAAVSRLSLPLLTSSHVAANTEDEDELPTHQGCPVHFYRDNASIFSESTHNPVFTIQKRQLPWEERFADSNVVHAYAPLRSSMARAMERRPHDQWRYVRDGHRRKRPPRDSHKGAVPGSTLYKKRNEALEQREAAQRARVGYESERVSILRGGSTEVRELSFLVPAASAPACLMPPRQRLPTLPRLQEAR